MVWASQSEGAREIFGRFSFFISSLSELTLYITNVAYAETHTHIQSVSLAYNYVNVPRDSLLVGIMIHSVV